MVGGPAMGRRVKSGHRLTVVNRVSPWLAMAWRGADRGCHAAFTSCRFSDRVFIPPVTRPPFSGRFRGWRGGGELAGFG